MRSVLIVGAVALFAIAFSTRVASAEGHRAVLLMGAATEQGTVVTYGPDGIESGPLARSVVAPFEKAGIEIVSTKGVSVPEATDSKPGILMGDPAATAFAKAAGAGIAIVVAVAARSDGRLRATGLLGQAASVRLRVLDVTTGRSVFDGKAEAAAYGREQTLARSEGSAAAIAKASRGLLPRLMLRWPAKRQGAGRLSLKITGADGWRAIATVLRNLSATKGVTEVHALQIRSDRVVLSLHSQQGAAQVVAALRRARIHNGSLSVRLAGTALDVRITMHTPSILPPVPNG